MAPQPMDEATRRQLAIAAERLGSDEALQTAFDLAQQAAQRDLTKVDPTDAIAVTRLQAEYQAIDRIRQMFEDMRRAAPQDKKTVR